MPKPIFSRNHKPLIMALVLTAVIYAIVYYSGGTSSPYPHFCYFPIMLIAFMGTWLETLIIAALASFAMSSWMMPLSVAQGTVQSGMGWVFRAVMFFAVAVFIKVATEARQKNQDQILETTRQMNQFSYSTLNALMHLAETRDPESTGRHLDKITAYARVILEELDIPETDKVDIVRVISLHDIGKVAIPDSILLKPGKLTDEEFAIMKRHAIIGGDILHEIQQSLPIEETGLRRLIQTTVDIVYCHHERPDGLGYPEGKMLEEIPVSARITALCDVYDALSSERPYKEAYPHDRCRDIIVSESGKQFDPEVVEAFLRAEDKFEAILNSCGQDAESDKIDVN